MPIERPRPWWRWPGRRLGAAALLLIVVAGFPGMPRAAAPLRIGSLLGDDAAAGFARADAPRRFEFPADHGAHPAFRSEWWYLNASLRPAGAPADADPVFGVQFTVFRQALRVQPADAGPWDPSQVYLGHLALTDVAAGRHRHAERLSRGHPGVAGVAAEPFRLWLDGWQLAAADADFGGTRLEAATEAFAVDLALEPRKPIVLQGEAGLSAKGPGQASYYYSLPRFEAVGNVRLGGRSVPVTGTAWLDREWSTSVLGAGQTGWDWFALQLDDGEDLMFYQLRRSDGRADPYDYAIRIDAAGASERFAADAFRLEPVDHWSDAAGVAWPVAWRLWMPGPDGPRTLRIEAALNDQRMATLITYWEGLVRVLDEQGRRIGSGYMELTGYD